MNFQQTDLDGDIDRLVQESLPKYKENIFLNRNVRHPKPPGLVSTPALVRLHPSSTSSPLARFSPFLSPQAHLHNSALLEDSATSISEVFKCLKNAVPARPKGPNKGRVVEPVISVAPPPVRGVAPPPVRGVPDYQETFEDCFVENRTERIESTVPYQEDVSMEDEVCSLYLWIIKPVPGLAAVRVEGKTSLTGNEFWQSGIVTKRINEKMVGTQSGSVYKLEGNMELMDAIAAGYSRSCAEAFWLGFPVDWKQLIEAHFNKQQYSSEPLDKEQMTLSEEQEEEICMVEAFDDIDQAESPDEFEATGIGIDQGTVEDILDTLDKDINNSLTDVSPSPVPETIDKTTKTVDGTSNMVTKSLEDNTAIKPVKPRRRGRPNNPATETADKPSKTLDSATKSVEKPSRTINSATKKVDNPSRTINSATKKVDNPSRTIKSATKKVDNPSRTINSVSKKEDNPPRTINNATKMVGRPLKSRTAVKVVQVKKGGNSKAGVINKGGNSKECVLSNWVIKPLPTGGGVQVMGLNHEGILWNSSAIERRLDKKRLLSSTASIYRLKGTIDELLTLQAGLPEELIDKFRNGFPKEWQELIQEHFTQTNKKQINTKTMQRSKTKRDTNKRIPSHSLKTPSENKTKAKASSKSEKIVRNVKSSVSRKHKDRASIGCTKERVQESRSSSKNSTLNSTASSVERPESIVITSSGKWVDLNDMPHSRSGRLIKPPLFSWAGQTVCQGEDGYYLKTLTKSGTKYCQEFQDNFWNAGKRIRNMYWKPNKNAGNESLVRKQSSSKKSLPSKEQSSSKKTLPSKTLHIKTHRQAQAEKASNRRKTDNDISIGDPLETSADSENSFPDIEKEIKVVLHKIRVSNRTNKGQVTARTRYQNIDDSSNTWKPSQTEAYSIDSCDETSNKKSPTHVKQDDKGVSKKRHLDQVEIVSSTTDEVCKPSPRRTRSSSSRNKVINETVRCDNENLVNMDRDRRLSRNCKRKSVELIVNSECDGKLDDTLECDTIPLNYSTRKRKTSLDINSSVSSLDNTLTEDVTWRPSEKERLNSAIRRTGKGEPHFWDKVAEIVGSKGPEACREEFYKTERGTTIKKKKRSGDLERPKVTALTANKGTLKRKRQLCEILTQHNENHSDNLFDATPFRKTRTRKKIEQVDGDSFYEELARNQGNSRFETPKGEIGRSVLPKFVSAKKTPVSSVIPEEYEERENVDSYVHQLMKRNSRGSRPKKILVTPKEIKKIPEKDADTPHTKLFRDIIRQQPSDSENHEDSELETDYYWDEQEINN